MRTRKPRLIEGKPGPGVTEETLHTIRDLISQDPIYADPAPTRPEVNRMPNQPPRPRRRAFEPDATAPPPRYVYSREDILPQPTQAPTQQASTLSRTVSALRRALRNLHMSPS